MKGPKTRVLEAFEERYGAEPSFLVRAPGRVNLIGEHTDYNGGFVLPLAIDRAVWLALRPREDSKVEIHSLEFKKTRTFNLENFSKEEGWLEYLKGTAWALQEAGFALGGWEGVSSSDVPRSSGLSSSAALELATARAFAAVSDLLWNPTQMAKLAQRAENEWVGVSCGIMDQLASAAGQEGKALLIDCRSLDIKAVPLPEDTAVVVLDTKTQRGLVDSAYNERRAQCEAAARAFGVSALRDVSMEEFEAEADRLEEVTRKRARHVISENARTLRAAEVMKRGDAQALGELMNESHASLRDDFEVSSDALNVMVQCALDAGCYGARMTGAGFGGCAVALVAQEDVERFVQEVAPCYEVRTGRTPEVYVCQATAGAAVV